MTNTQYIKVVFFLLVPFYACSYLSCGPAGSFCKWENFKTLDYEKKMDVIEDCTPEDQIEIYFQAASRRSRDQDDIKDAIASSGARLIPAIIKRIEDRVERRLHIEEVPFLLNPLVMMENRGYYHVAGDKELMTRLEKAVASLPDQRKDPKAPITKGGETIKETCEYRLDWIRNPPWKKSLDKQKQQP